MGITHLSGLQVAGVPTMGMGGGIPMFTGTWYFVDAVYGSDGNVGTADSPLATIARAYELCKDGRNDVVVLVGHPTTSDADAGTHRLSSQLLWAKSATHMIGMCAPTMVGQRARISTAVGATTNIADLLKVTGHGCYFGNFSIFQGVGQSGTDEQLCQITGKYNYFENVAFQGMGSSTGAGRAGSYVLYINGGTDNTFINCQIGVDTVARTAANSSVRMRGGAARNVFINCVFPLYATANSPLFVDTNASGAVDRFNVFKNCFFNNAVNNTSGTAITAVAAYNSAQGGTTVFDNCTVVGANDWTGTDTGTVRIAGPVPNGDTSGMAVNADAT